MPWGIHPLVSKFEEVAGNNHFPFSLLDLRYLESELRRSPTPRAIETEINEQYQEILENFVLSEKIVTKDLRENIEVLDYAFDKLLKMYDSGEKKWKRAECIGLLELVILKIAAVCSQLIKHAGVLIEKYDIHSDKTTAKLRDIFAELSKIDSSLCAILLSIEETRVNNVLLRNMAAHNHIGKFVLIEDTDNSIDMIHLPEGDKPLIPYVNELVSEVLEKAIAYYERLNHIRPRVKFKQ